jgi:hypothetical protein
MADETTEKKVVKKPLNPLAAKPGQNYGSTKYVPTKEYDSGQITFKKEDAKEETKQEDKK